MKSKILLLFLLLIPFTLAGQTNPPPYAAFTFSGSSWVAAATSAGATGALAFQPPAVALYCLNGSSQWVPATSACFGGGGTVTGSGTTNSIPLWTSPTALGNSALTDNGTIVTSTEAFVMPVGAALTPSIRFTGQTGTGFYVNASGLLQFVVGGATPTANSTLGLATAGAVLGTQGGGNGNAYLAFATGATDGGTIDTYMRRGGAGIIYLSSNGSSSAGNGTLGLGTLNTGVIQTTTNCAVNSVSPAACGAAASGAFVVPTSTTTYTVATSAVTANSLIFIQPRTYVGALPSSPTCVTPVITADPVPSAISAGVSFTFTLSSTTGQTCWSYLVVN